MRILEPWPPEAAGDPFGAPDPTAPGVRGALPVLSPLGTGDLTWDDLCGDEPALLAWCRPRWLAGPCALAAPPAGLGEATARLHRLARDVLAPWRHAAQGRAELRWTLGGFGTPFVAGRRQLRVVDGLLVAQDGDTAEVLAPATVGEAAAAVGAPRPDGDGEPVAADPGAAAWLGGWFGFATRALEELRVGEPDRDRRRVQLAPEQFRLAVELGDGPARGVFGASPGGAGHDGPHLFVTGGAKGRLAGSDRWDPATGGATLPLAELLGAPNHLDAAVAFFAHHRLLLERG